MKKMILLLMFIPLFGYSQQHPYDPLSYTQERTIKFVEVTIMDNDISFANCVNNHPGYIAIKQGHQDSTDNIKLFMFDCLSEYPACQQVLKDQRLDAVILSYKGAGFNQNTKDYKVIVGFTVNLLN